MGTQKKNQVTSIEAIKARVGGLTELPSGITVQVRNTGGLQAFLSAGIIPNSLMSIVKKGMAGNQVGAEEIMPDGEIDPALLSDMNELLNKIANRVIVDPVFNLVPSAEDMKKWNKSNPNKKVSSPEELRRDDLLYVDELPEEDKMFIFQWVTGGTRDLERFREQHAASMDTLAANTSAEGNTK